MNTRYPKPVLRAGKWQVDLRRWNLPDKVPLGPASLSELDATNMAWSKLSELRDARLAEPRAQLELPASGGPRTMAQAIDEWSKRKLYDTDAGREYGAKVAALALRELGAYELGAFAGHEGSDRLLAYLASLRERELASRTIRNRFSVIGQVLRLCAERHWLAGMPSIPRMPVRPPPRYEWISEATFRAVRASSYAELKVRPQSRNGWELPAAEPLAAWVCRRRCFLSLMFSPRPSSRGCGHVHRPAHFPRYGHVRPREHEIRRSRARRAIRPGARATPR